MSEQPERPETTGTDRFTRANTDPGGDPREIEREARDADRARHLDGHRHVEHAEPATKTDPGDDRGALRGGDEPADG
jgi:hypothetical protein